jgi:hypothetical protein
MIAFSYDDKHIRMKYKQKKNHKTKNINGTPPKRAQNVWRKYFKLFFRIFEKNVSQNVGKI